MLVDLVVLLSVASIYRPRLINTNALHAYTSMSINFRQVKCLGMKFRSAEPNFVPGNEISFRQNPTDVKSAGKRVPVFPRCHTIMSHR